MEKSFYTLSSSKNVTVVGSVDLVRTTYLGVFDQFEIFSVPPLSAPIITGGQEFYSEVSPTVSFTDLRTQGTLTDFCLLRGT